MNISLLTLGALLIGLFLAGFVPPLLTYLAVERGLGFAMPMLYGTVSGAVIVVIALWASPETKGINLSADVRLIANARGR